MVDHKKKTFFVKEDNVNKVSRELNKWNIPWHLNNEQEMSFSVQSNNTVYEINLLIYNEEHVSTEQYPEVVSFTDVQEKLFGKAIWDWK